MKFILGSLIIAISIFSRDPIQLGVVTAISTILLLITTPRRFFLTSIFIISLLPVIVSPDNPALLINSLRLILRFEGVYYVAGSISGYLNKVKLPTAVRNSPLYTAITLSLNIFPHLSEFITTSFKQQLLKKNFPKMIPGYISFLLLYLTNYAEELSWEIDIFIMEKRNGNYKTR